jgi:hypothetical protein
MMRTHLQDELSLLIRAGVLNHDDARILNARGHETSFVLRSRLGS